MPKASFTELVNVSTSQSLTRSIRTSITTVSTMIIVSVVAYIYGVGMIAGTYASLCIASPLWVWWNERKNAKTVKSKK